MRSMRFVMVAAGLSAAAMAQHVVAEVVVNIDFEAGVPGDSNHVGSDGVLRSLGGTLWNSVTADVNAFNLADEFGGLTPFDVVFLDANGFAFDDPGINNLQDSGVSGEFFVVGLVPGAMYEIVAWVGYNGGFLVHDASGSSGFIGFGDPGADGWGLPGTEGDGGDYFHVTGLVAFDTGTGIGVWFQTDGQITGLQVKGPIPVPGTLAALAFGAVVTRRGRKRKD